ncbi:hypothetical protein SCYAM73S_01314 [Streptomyces cyaneofuscatus]
MSVIPVRNTRSPPAGDGSRRPERRARARTSSASNVLPRPPAARTLLSWPRLTYAYTVSGFTPSSSAASRVVSRGASGRPGSG